MADRLDFFFRRIYSGLEFYGAASFHFYELSTLFQNPCIGFLPWWKLAWTLRRFIEYIGGHRNPIPHFATKQIIDRTANGLPLKIEACKFDSRKGIDKIRSEHTHIEGIRYLPAKPLEIERILTNDERFAGSHNFFYLLTIGCQCTFSQAYKAFVGDELYNETGKSWMKAPGVDEGY
jgi:hypothetical protein